MGANPIWSHGATTGVFAISAKIGIFVFLAPGIGCGVCMHRGDRRRPRIRLEGEAALFKSMSRFSHRDLGGAIKTYHFDGTLQFSHAFDGFFDVSPLLFDTKGAWKIEILLTGLESAFNGNYCTLKACPRLSNEPNLTFQLHDVP